MGDGENYGGVVLCGDAGEGLEVAQLERRRALDQHLGGEPQRPAGLVLPLGRDNLDMK